MDHDVTTVAAHCLNRMEKNQQKVCKEALLGELAKKLVEMGWFTAGSPGLTGMMDFFSQAPDDQIKGLIKGCERRIADPSSCGCGPHSK
jgi:hypothetical protein